MCGVLKKITTLGGLVPAASFFWGGGGAIGEVRGQNFLMSSMLIWIPHEILSILSIHTWGKNDILPPIMC